MEAEPITILVVEDSRTQAAHLTYVLEQHAYQVTVARHGCEALDWLQTHLPALVISDISMPEMDGYTLCAQIKQDPRLAALPMILLTSLSDPSDIMRGLVAGADNFVTKPFDEGFLLARIRTILTRRAGDASVDSGDGLAVVYAGRSYPITVSRQHMLDLLLAVYETAVQKNLDLLRAQEALARANEELREVAIRDGLTGLFNRRELDRMLQIEAERQRRFGQPLALVLLDIDHFKLINDTYGHQVGDAVLRWIAELMQARVRSVDRVARYGGEEFALLPIEATEAQAFTIAEHLCDRIAAHPFTWTAPGGPPITIPITASLGVAVLSGAGLSVADLIAAADAALYEAKHRGRNRVVRFAELPPPAQRRDSDVGRR